MTPIRRSVQYRSMDDCVYGLGPACYDDYLIRIHGQPTTRTTFNPFHVRWPYFENGFADAARSFIITLSVAADAEQV